LGKTRLVFFAVILLAAIIVGASLIKRKSDDDKLLQATNVALQATIAALQAPQQAQGRPPTAAPGAQAPAYASATPAPSATPVPPPTPVPDTPAGTVLDLGQTWRQGGLEAAIENSKLFTLTDQWGHTPGVMVTLRLLNRRPQDLVLNYTQDNITAIDNLGRTLQVGELVPAESAVIPFTQQSVLAAGQSARHDRIYAVAAVTDPSVTEVTFTVSISSVNGACWRVPIYH